MAPIDGHGAHLVQHAVFRGEGRRMEISALAVLAVIGLIVWRVAYLIRRRKDKPQLWSA